MKNVILLVFIIMTIGCSQRSENLSNYTKSDTILEYQSEANGLAYIKLYLLNDDSFSLFMRIIPQPMSDDKDTSIQLVGKWYENKNLFRLCFTENKTDIYSLFDTNYIKNNEFNILNDSTVEINSSFPSLTIWGVVCEKIENKNAP